MYNKYFTMKRSELKEAIKAEITSVLSENRYDINDPNSPLGRLNDEYESSGLKGIVDNYGLDVVLMILSSGEYGDRLNEAMSDEEREDKLQQAKRGGGKEKPLRKLAAIGKKEDEKDLKEGRRRVVDYDNRDDRTTELFLDNGDSVEVDVIELYDNLKENNPTFADIREDEDEDDKKAYKGAAKMDKKKSKRDKVIDAYNEIGGGKEVKEKAKKAKEGDKEALNWLKTNQPKIKAYNDLKK